MAIVHLNRHMFCMGVKVMVLVQGINTPPELISINPWYSMLRPPELMRLA